MAEKRMFTQKIIDSDAFLEMPLSAQALYFHLNMRADDDGFVNNPRKITKYVSASDDDLKILLMKRFIIGFASGVIVIKHWRMHNTLKLDRYHPTDYQEEFAQLGIKANKAYTDHPEALLPQNGGTKAEPEWNQNGTGLEPEVREGLGLGLEESREEEKTEGTEPQASPVLTIPLNDGTEYPISEEYAAEMQKLYPSVDVMQQLRAMRAWSLSNPERRKTKRGVKSFINRWLSSEQDKAETKKPAKRKVTTFMDL